MFQILFLSALGPDLRVFIAYFPFMNAVFQIFQAIAFGLILVMGAFAIYSAMFGPLTDKEHPLITLFKMIAAAVLVYFSINLCQSAMNTAKIPFNALLSATETGSAGGSFTSIAGYLITALSNSNAAVSIVEIILMLSIGIGYIKLALEAVERYIVLGVLSIGSPLALSCFATKATSGVFQAFIRMYISALLLLSLNVVFLRAFDSAIGSLITNGGWITMQDGSLQGGVFLWFFCVIALLRVGQKADSILSTLGLNTVQTGGSLGNELIGMGATMFTASKMATQGMGRASRGGSGAGSMAGMSTVGGAKGMAMMRENVGNIPVGGMARVSQNKITGAQAFNVVDANGRNSIVTRTPVTAGGQAPKGAYMLETDKNGNKWYRQAQGANAGAYLTPQFGVNGANQGFVLTSDPKLSNQHSGSQASAMYSEHYKNNLASGATASDAASRAHQQTAQSISEATYDRALKDGLSANAAAGLAADAQAGYMDYHGKSQEMLGDSMGYGTMLENDPTNAGVMHAYSTAPDGHGMTQDMYLSTATTTPEGAYHQVEDADHNLWNVVDRAQRPGYGGSEFQGSDDLSFQTGHDAYGDNVYSRREDVANYFAGEQFPEIEEKLGSKVVDVDYSHESQGYYDVQTEEGKFFRIQDTSESRPVDSATESIGDQYDHEYMIIPGTASIAREPMYTQDGNPIMDEHERIATQDVVRVNYGRPAAQAEAPRFIESESAFEISKNMKRKNR